ncbi:hypothetical protein BDQ12DRAFT_722916 [Crucibulum laeve]|uniref:DUF6533 domain-containing protein n=1 Tax=Crucibulum laeve TaxID=68775 RepID=A0A5C3M3B2_9AGAR|nr:hypothetical protein BDQ12DRAFT_722916 [Crucibulum laeve]
MGSQALPGVIEDVSEMYRTTYMGFASFTILIWDHVDTFADEVELIWQGKKGPIVYLFLINRYVTPLGFMVNLFAYLSPVWTPERCRHFIRFEGSMTVIGINIVGMLFVYGDISSAYPPSSGMMMLLRIYALYYRQRAIIFGVAVLLLIQFTMNAWLLTRGEAVVHNPASGVHACTMIFDPSISAIASSSAWLPLLYDTVVFSLTLYRTYPYIRRKSASYVMKRLLEDGLIYYSAIFTVTAVLTLMIIFAPPGLKNITAQLELLLTVAMMSRITLNLKKSVHKFDHSNGMVLPSLFNWKRSQGQITTNGTAVKFAAPANVPVIPPRPSLNVNNYAFNDSDYSDTLENNDAYPMSILKVPPVE